MARVHEALSGEIISAALEVHAVLGPGLLERAYRAASVHELPQRGLEVRSEAPVPLQHKGVSLGTSLPLDLLVADAVVVELEAVVAFDSVHTAQLLSYLRLTGKQVGLLIDLHVPKHEDGLERVVL